MANFKKTDKVRIYVSPAPNVPGKHNVTVEVTRAGSSDFLARKRVASNVTPQVAAKVAAEAKRKLAGTVDDVKILRGPSED